MGNTTAHIRIACLLVLDSRFTHIYKIRDAFEDDWVRVRRPFVPEVELPAPWFDQNTYAIVIVPGPQDEMEKPVVYEDGETDPLSNLVDEPPILATESEFGHSDVAETQSNRDDFEDDPDAAVEVFVSARLVQEEGPRSRPATFMTPTLSGRRRVMCRSNRRTGSLVGSVTTSTSSARRSTGMERLSGVTRESPSRRKISNVRFDTTVFRGITASSD